MGLLDGLLGGGDPYALYGDLLTDKQRAALRDQQMGQGLLRMAGAFAEAAKPSLLPTGGIGSALGRAAGALAGQEDEGLKSLGVAQQLRQAQQEMAWRQKLSPLMLEYYQRMNGGGAAPTMPPGPTTSGPSLGPNAPPPPGAAAPDLADLWRIPGDTPNALPPPAAATRDPAWLATRLSAADSARGEYGAEQAPTGGRPPDQVVRPPGQRSSFGDPNGGLLSLAGYGGAPNGMPPFRLAAASSSPGAGGDGQGAGLSGSAWEIANNNFGGMRKPGVNAGPSQGGFQSFATPEEGLAKIGWQLDRYASGATTGKPLNTVRQIVSTWAPPHENNTPLLINRAARIVGVDPDTVINVSDPATKAKLIEATIRNEQGGRLPVDPEMIGAVASNPSLASYAGASSRGDRPADIVLPSGGGGGGGQMQALQALMQLVKSPGDTADEGGGDPWIMQNKVGFPTLTNPDTPPIRWTNELQVPFGQDPGDFLPGGDAGTARSGATNLDTVIPSGRRLPITRAQYNPLSGATGAGGGAPAAAPTIPGMPGVIPGIGKTPEQIATLNALMKMYGMKSPLSDLLETYYKSPGYLAGVKAAESTAEYGVKQKFEPGLQADILRATIDPKVQLKEKEAIIERRSDEIKANRDLYNKLQQDFAKDNMTMETGPDGKVKLVPLPDAQRIRTENVQKQKEAEEDAKLIDVTVTLPGESRPREMKITGRNYKDAMAGKAVPEIGLPAMVGIKLGKPVYSPTETALGPKEADDLFKQRNAAENAVRSVEVNNAARRLIDGGIFAGAGQDLNLTIAKIGDALGQAGKTTQETIANTEAYFAIVGQNVGNMISLFGSGTGLSEGDRKFAERMAGGKEKLTEESIRKIFDMNDTLARAAVDKHNKRVSGIAPGATMLPMTVQPPAAYEAPPKGAAPPAQHGALRAEAQAAIAKGADRAKVIERLRGMGVDTGGL